MGLFGFYKQMHTDADLLIVNVISVSENFETEAPIISLNDGDIISFKLL